MRRCSGSEGTSNSSLSSSVLDIRCRVVPRTNLRITENTFCEFSCQTNHRLLNCPGEGLKIHTSTTVMHAPLSPGNSHALPIGSGIRAIKMSPCSRYVHRRRFAASLVKNLDDLSRNLPTPTSANWMSLTSPLISWSFDSTQSPSTRSPSGWQISLRLKGFWALCNAITRASPPTPASPLQSRPRVGPIRPESRAALGAPLPRERLPCSG